MDRSSSADRPVRAIAWPARLKQVPLTWVLLVAVAVNLILIVAWFITYADRHGVDYGVLAQASQYANPYDQPLYVWSPVAVYPLRLLVPLGLEGWVVLHALALVPLGWPLALVVGLSYPFWVDLMVGNVFVFVTVAGFTAIRGSRVGALTFAVMAVLMPRPIMLPVLVWLLWKQPWTRLPFAVIAVAHLALVAWTGLADEWVVRLINLPVGVDHPINILPSRWIGLWWWPIGLAIAAVLTWKGRLGFASLLASPYLYQHYWLALLFELRRRDEDQSQERRNSTSLSSR